MTIATKVWCPALEPQPKGLFNRSTCPHAPPGWFREEPEYAAELYALELGGEAERVIQVVDTIGAVFTFKVSTKREIRATVQPV